MNNCPKCGAKIYEGYDFCCECGCSLAEFKTAENPAVKNEACPNAEPAPAGATMNIPGTQEKRGSNKKKIAVFGAVAALLLIAILVVTMVSCSGGGFDKDDATRFMVGHLVCYVPSDWDYLGSEDGFKVYSKFEGDDFASIIIGETDVSVDYDEMKELAEESFGGEFKKISLPWADYAIYSEEPADSDGTQTMNYVGVHGEHNYIIICSGTGSLYDRNLFKAMVKSFVYPE